ncbi:MAG TPA: cell division protein ZapA [Candidatus Hydrogenedentes bacterium]|nr:cell division protein ZapA [Candidatus Hydrogenedentota bacterium]
MIRPVDPTTRARLGNVTLEVPVYQDPETSARIAREVTEKFEEISARADVVNTLHFALLTAYAFACELDALRREKESDEAEIGRRLQRLQSMLKQLTRDAQDLFPESDGK